MTKTLYKVLILLFCLVFIYERFVLKQVLAATWDISTASYDSVSFSVGSQATNPMSLAFSSDGIKMYVTDDATDKVYQYSLSSAWDASTASYDNVSFSLTQDTAPYSITFKSDGTKMYMVGSFNDRVYQYSLSSAWDLSTASYDSVSFSVSGQSGSSEGIAFKSDGTKMYIASSVGNRVYQYSLSSAWDVSSASYDSIFFSANSQESLVRGLAFKSDGSKMYIIGNGTKKIYQYTLSTPWAVSSASYDSVSFSVSTQDTFPMDVVFKTDGSKFYIVGSTNDRVYQYSMTPDPTPTPTPTSTPTPTNTPTPTPTNTPTPTPTATPTPTPTTSSSTSSSSSSSCSATAPGGTPNLYQVNSGQNSIELYFTPVAGADSYYIIYGTNREANQFATSFSQTDSSGAVTYTIGSLSTGITYYFQVRAGKGCATGSWSNVTFGTTKGEFTSDNPVTNVVKKVEQTLNSPKELKITSSNLTSKKSSVCSYIVESGDNLWNIAQEKLGTGALFSEIKNLNNLSGNLLSVGQELKLPCDEQEETIAKAKKEAEQVGVTIDVKILSMKNEPVEGAMVTLHSNVQVAKTDKDGIAHFEKVEEGEHRVLISYNGYDGEQKLNIDGAKKTQTLTLQVQLGNGFSSPAVIAVMLGIGAIILLLLFIIFKKKLISF